MRLNPKLALSNAFMARIAAQSIVYRQFDPKRVVADLRPDIKCYRAFFAKLMDEPAIRHEIGVVMNRTENNAQKFLKLMWNWLEAAPDADDKSVTEQRLTAARILAKGYISDKQQPAAPARPFVVDGMDAGINNLTGVVPSDKKVVQ